MLRIQILGIGCRKSRALKANVMEALDHVPMAVQMEEVESLEAIVQSDIHSIPALLINGNIVSEGEVPTVSELEGWLETYQQQDYHLNNILVPVDFSLTAANAFRFAMAMMKGRAAQIDLLHVYHPHLDSATPYAMTISADLLSQKEWQLKHFTKENYPLNGNGNGGSKVNTKLSLGFASDEIIKDSKNADLIIMGTTGDSTWLEHIFGKVSSQVSRYAHCPVLLVPPGATFKGFNTLVYASDSEVVDNLTLFELVEWLEAQQAEIHVVHVEKSYSDPYLMKRMEPLSGFSGQPASLNLTMAEVASTDTLKALNTYASTRNADLLVMNTTKRSLLENFFHKSLTKQMILNAQMPILVLHQNTD